VLIAAVRRTGSTLLTELLTELPRAFVFREPKLFRGRVSLKPGDLERLSTQAAVRLPVAPADQRREDPVQAALRFREQIIDPVARVVEQVGIKEIRYGKRWQDVVEVLAAGRPLRVVALGRDPRDMYLSLAYRARERRVPLVGDFGPAAVAADIEKEFRVQRELIQATGALAVRYEDLCSDPRVVAEIRRFVDSPVEGPGAVGTLKLKEHAMHEGVVTDRRVERWRSEPDAGLLADAEEAGRLLGGYRRFWGYDGE
jgi:hypothetical protein